MFKVEPLNLWPKWAAESLDALANCEEKADDSLFFDGADEWTGNALTEVIKMLNPTLTRLRTPASGCFCLGALTGHQEWMINNIDALFPPEEILDLLIQDFDRRLTRFLKVLSKSQKASVLKQIRQNQAALNRLFNTFEKARDLKKTGITKVLHRSVSEAVGKERLEFLEGYTKALRKPAISDPENMSPREKMLSIILLNWRDVQGMKNRSVLRKSLGTLFNQPDVYNHEFVQGICKDIGLDLADRGRG